MVKPQLTATNYRPIIAIHIGLLALCAYFISLIVEYEWHGSWQTLFANPASLDLPNMLFQNNTLPRLSMAVLSGGILGIATILLQQMTHNPLAADSTLAVSSGAQLSLLIASIFVPQWFLYSGQWVAFIGASISLLSVLLLSIDREGLLPIRVILAGLMVNFYCGALSSILILFFTEESRSVLSWGAGSLVQDSWHDVLALLQRLGFAVVMTLLLIRPLSIMGLGDDAAKSLGIPLRTIRFMAMLLIAYLCASVVSMVGMMGFIGLATAAIVHQLGVRRLAVKLCVAFTLGALLLLLTDSLLILLKHRTQIDLPTGAVTALIGAPVLLWLIFKAMPTQLHIDNRASRLKIRDFNQATLWFIGINFILGIFVSLFVSRDANGWNISAEVILLELRYPRLLFALAAGLMLSCAGVLLQRLTQNPMASPELLGISSGTALGVLVATVFSITAPLLLWGIGIASAITTLLLMIVINFRNNMQPEKVLLTGMAIAAAFESFTRLFTSSGDPRVQSVLVWLSGSTYQAQATVAISIALIAIVLFCLSGLLCRWLGLLGLSHYVAQALGLNLKKARYILIFFSAVLTALATLMLGPLSFVGLLSPHLARALGFHKPLPQLISAGVLGMWIMILADWLGRNLLFPYEIPAGIIATLLGGSYFLGMMRKL